MRQLCGSCFAPNLPVVVQVDLPVTRFIHGFWLSYEWNPEIFTNLTGEIVVDFRVARNRGSAILMRVAPPRVTSTFTNKDATLLAQMLEQCLRFIR